MSAKKRDVPVLPSVLDRLIDDEPENQREAPLTSARVLELLRRSIQRDVENLLNTRRRCEEIPERLEGTLAGYGVPDLVGTDLGSARNRRRFLRELERLLALHEPRFRSVKIKTKEGTNVTNRSLQFEIEAVVKAEPAPENISLSSSIEPVTRTINVRV